MLLAACADSTRAQQTAPPLKEITAPSYWYNVGLERATTVGETDTEITVEIQAKHGRVRSRVSKAQIANPELKSQGLKQALAELIQWTKIDTTGFSNRKLPELTGQRFAEPSEWESWYRTNGPYLAWSERLKRFIVDEDAKKAGTPTEIYRRTHPWREPPE